MFPKQIAEEDFYAATLVAAYHELPVCAELLRCLQSFPSMKLVHDFLSLLC